MYIYQVSCFVLLLTISSAEVSLHDPCPQSFVDMINSKQTSWKAGRIFSDSRMTLPAIQKLMGAFEDKNIMNLAYVKHSEEVKANLPESFDPRDKWPYCPSLDEIRNQGPCGSCWAFGAVEAMTDRYCIYSNGMKHFHFSAEDLVSCCSTCGELYFGGCLGGYASAAWKYWKDYGIVSGGGYNSSEGCRPYEIAPCDSSDDCHNAETPKCKKTCEESYPSKYEADKKYGKNYYTVAGENDIKAEIFRNGPVEGTLKVYRDFLCYKSGVYKYTLGKKIGYHAIKIMGWGVENGEKYWLIANSWGSNWGENGFFKILRGNNHCEIETPAIAGEPLY